MRLEWEIPAGSVEDGESKEEAARRECMEETRCTIYVLKIPLTECLTVSVMSLPQGLIQKLWTLIIMK